MRTEGFKRGVVSILLAFALVFSMISAAPLASPSDWVNRPEPGGTIIDVVPGDNFLIRHVLEWDEPRGGVYTVIIEWDCYDNEPSQNFTFLGASAYFTTGDYVGESIPAVVTLGSGPSLDYPGSTRYTLWVSCPPDNRDPRNGQFNVDITLSASGAGGVPHIVTDNHPIPFELAGVTMDEELILLLGTRDPITIRVSPWQLIETWTGPIETPAAWRLIETWTGAIEAPQNYTPTGENVQVTLVPGVSVTFENVTTSGVTTVTTDNKGPHLSTRYKIVGIEGKPIYYDITTTAAYSENIRVCISYDATQVDGEEEDLRLEQRVDGWNDITILPVDTENNIICGTTDNLSIFIVVEPVWTGTAEFGLENRLYAVSLDADLWLGEGSKLVIKFYSYTNIYRGENVVWSGTTPDNVSFSKIVPHPLGVGVRKARLDLTTDDTDNVISTIATFTVTRDVLHNLNIIIYLEWPFATPERRNERFAEIVAKYLQWAFAP